MYKACFFDLYGTLVDIRTDEEGPSLWRGMAEFFSLGGAVYTPARLRERYLALCARETAALAAARPELGAEGVEIELRTVFRCLWEEKGLVPSAARLEDTALVFRALSFRRPPRRRKGVGETLEGLRRKGLGLYLLSNAQGCFTEPELRRLGLWEGVFDGIFLSSDFGVKKPAGAFFREALARAGLSAHEVLMVGNDPDSDIRGAHAVGMESRYIHTRLSPERRGPLPASCREIAALTELLKEG